MSIKGAPKIPCPPSMSDYESDMSYQVAVDAWLRHPRILTQRNYPTCMEEVDTFMDEQRDAFEKREKNAKRKREQRKKRRLSPDTVQEVQQIDTVIQALRWQLEQLQIRRRQLAV